MSKRMPKHKLEQTKEPKAHEKEEDGGESKQRRVRRRVPTRVPAATASAATGSVVVVSSSSSAATKLLRGRIHSAAALPDTAAAASWPVEDEAAPASSSSSAAAAAASPAEKLAFTPFDIDQKLRECKETIGALPFRLPDVQNKGTPFAGAFETLLYHMLGQYNGAGFSTDLVKLVCGYTSMFPIMLLTAFERDGTASPSTGIANRSITALWFTCRTLFSRESDVCLRMSTMREWVEDATLFGKTDGLLVLRDGWYNNTLNVWARGLDKPDRPYSLHVLAEELRSASSLRRWMDWAPSKEDEFFIERLPRMDYSISTGLCFELEAAPAIMEFIEPMIGMQMLQRECRLPFWKFIVLSGIVIAENGAFDSATGYALLGRALEWTFAMGDKQPFAWLINDVGLSPDCVCDWTRDRIRFCPDANTKNKRHKLQRRLSRWFSAIGARRGLGSVTFRWASSLLHACILPEWARRHPVQPNNYDDDDSQYGCFISEWREPEDTVLATTPEEEIISVYNCLAPPLPGHCKVCHEKTNESDFTLNSDGSKTGLCRHCDGQ